MPSPRDIAAVLGSIAEGSPLGLAATEGEAHVVRYANPALCRLAGVALIHMLGKPLSEALPQLQEQVAVALMDRAYTTGRGGRAQNLGTPRAGEGTHATYTVWPIAGDGGSPSGLIVQISDTTEQVRERDRAADAASEIREANQRLLTAGLEAQEQTDTQVSLNTALRDALDERDRALGQADAALAQAEAALRVRDEFLAIAAHELRTPLAAVKGHAQLVLRALERDELDGTRTRRHTEGIRDAADRLERLLVDLMDVSRARSGDLVVRPERMDLSRLVDNIALRYAEELNGSHRLTADLPDAPVEVEGDAVRLEQVLDNLLRNAVKYTPQGGTIRVRLAVGSQPPRVDSQGAILTVRDSGIGLPPEEAARIFEPFGRASNARQHGAPGMGLGLYICRRIVDAHGGGMWAESPGEGMGTTVAIWLPLPSTCAAPALDSHVEAH